MKKLFQQIWRFGIVGGIAFVIDTGLLMILKEYLHVYYLIANVISFTVSTIYNYIASVNWVFDADDEKKKNKKYTALFVILSVIGLGINQLCMFAFVSGFGIYYLVAKVLATGIVMVFNFVTRKRMYEPKSNREVKIKYEN